MTACIKTSWRRCLIVLVLCAPAPAIAEFTADARVSGSWFDPLHDGEGFLIEVVGPDRAVVYWFTYDMEGRQVWIVGDGPIDGDRITISNAVVTSGGIFGPDFNPQDVVRTAWGTLEFVFLDCDAATFSYDGPAGFGSGVQNLIRLTSLARLKCNAARGFRLGFTPFPHTTLAGGIESSYQILRNDADIVAHHFDDGIPWPEALAGGDATTYPPNLVAEWEFRRASTPGGHALYLAITPISISRDALAPYRGESPDTPLSVLGEPWASAAFDDQIVKDAYFNHLVNAVEFFRPDYLAFAIEANLLLKLRPDLWAAFLELQATTYDRMRDRYPSLPLFVSLTAPDLLEGFTDADHAAQLAGLEAVMQHSDYLGLSLYPWISAFLTDPLPDSLYADIDALSDRPIVIAETGYPADGLEVDVGDGTTLVFEGTPEKQLSFISTLLEEAERRHFRFVINFVPRDYDPLCEEIDCADAQRLWEDTGLYDENGVARPALDAWRQWLARRLAR